MIWLAVWQKGHLQSFIHVTLWPELELRFRGMGFAYASHARASGRRWLAETWVTRSSPYNSVHIRMSSSHGASGFCESETLAIFNQRRDHMIYEGSGKYSFIHLPAKKLLLYNPWTLKRYLNVYANQTADGNFPLLLFLNTTNKFQKNDDR